MVGKPVKPAAAKALIDNVDTTLTDRIGRTGTGTWIDLPSNAVRRQQASRFAATEAAEDALQWLAVTLVDVFGDGAARYASDRAERLIGLGNIDGAVVWAEAAVVAQILLHRQRRPVIN